MRVLCPHCKRRHDVPIRAVLAEAERLKQVRQGVKPARDPAAPEANGNVLTPEEIEERKRRERGRD